MSPRTFQAQTPLEALLVEQALAIARQLQETADAAPDGQVLARVEAAALPAGRAFTRRAVASWSFDRAATHLQEFCGLVVCDNTIRRVCQEHGGAMRDWQRDAPAASAAFRAADGDVEFQTDGTAVNTTPGWRELRLSIFAKRRRGRPPAGPGATEPRHLPAPHVRVVQAGIRTGDQLGPGWRRQAARLGLRDTAAVTAIADGAKWIWRQWAAHLPGAAGVLDVYHAGEHLWAAAR